MNPTDLLKAADQASRASDRWMFVMMLGLLILFGWFVIKWLIKQLELQRDSYQTLIKESVVEHQKLNEILVGVIQKNTIAIQDFSQKLESCPATLNKKQT